MTGLSSNTIEITLHATAEERGPQLARYGFLIVGLVAAAGLISSYILQTPYRRWNLGFYSFELSLAVILTTISFTERFKARWDSFVLGSGLLLLVAITGASIAADNFRTAVLGLLLIQMGAAAFLPWRPSHQLWFSAGAVASVAGFTVFTSHLTPELFSDWVVLLAGAIIGQVACVSSYRYRSALGRQLQTVTAARERLAAEVREREIVIDELRETQQELMVSREAALAASRARSEFLSSMSHEIRTPMNSVLGMSELLSQTNLNPEQRRYLNLIQAGGETLLELINSILDLARMESGRVKLQASEFDLREMIEQLLDTLSVSAFAKNIELVGRIDSRVPERVVGDSFRLRQILTNLISNAVKFTEYGQVALRVSMPAPGRISFAVADTGIGIAPELLKTIFEPFTQADSSSARSFGGSGLGLAIVSRLVGFMSGELSVESEPGKGSTFSFVVPFATAEAPARDHPRLLAGVSALVIDDNQEACAAAAEILSGLGAVVDRCSSGREAIKVLEREAHNGSKHELVLMDAGLPDMRLAELAGVLASSTIDRSRVVIMLPPCDLTRDLSTLRSAGLTAYVTKPLKVADVASVCSGAVRPAVRSLPRPKDVEETPVRLPAARVLIADDVSVNRSLIHDLLKQTPLQIDDAADGKEALLKVMTGAYDIVLMDMQMPVIDGYHAAVMIRNWERADARAHLPIVALTASALKADVDRALEAGCDAHLAKPFRQRTLLRVLAEQLAGKSLHSRKMDQGPSRAQAAAK